MGSRGCLLMLLLLLTMLSQDHNRLLAFIKLKSVWSCPHVRAKCLYKELPTCFSDRDCKAKEKCCLLSCGMKCIGLDEDPCEEVLKVKPCDQAFTRWYFNVTDNRCFPIEFNQCSEGKNNFQNRNVCRKTCLAFGHGTTIKLFELEGEPFTVII